MRACLAKRPEDRPAISQLLRHPWIRSFMRRRSGRAEGGGARARRGSGCETVRLAAGLLADVLTSRVVEGAASQHQANAPQTPPASLSPLPPPPVAASSTAARRGSLCLVSSLSLNRINLVDDEDAAAAAAAAEAAASAEGGEMGAWHDAAADSALTAALVAAGAIRLPG